MSALAVSSSPTCAAPQCANPAGKHCGRCENIFYCSVTCQTNHWKEHKALCQPKVSASSSSAPQVQGLGSSSIQVTRANSSPAPDVPEKIKKIQEQLTPKNLTLYREFKEEALARDWRQGLPAALQAYVNFIDENELRELITLMGFYNEVQGKENISDLYGQLPGMKILRKAHANENHIGNDCATYAFHDQDWYNMRSRYALFGSCSQAFGFLQERGYVPMLAPQVGDLVVYVTSQSKPAHYGIVSKVDGPSITVCSKWDKAHIYEHLLEAIPMLYGNAYTFFSPPGNAIARSDYSSAHDAK